MIGKNVSNIIMLRTVHKIVNPYFHYYVITGISDDVFKRSNEFKYSVSDYCNINVNPELIC